MFFRVVSVVGLCAVAGTACQRSRPASLTSNDASNAEPSSVATTRSAEIPATAQATQPPPTERETRPAPTGEIETVDVPGDSSVLVVVGVNTKRPIIHLHGMCAEPRSDLEAWSSSVSEHGTIIAVLGDASCPNGGSRWTNDAPAIDTRIDAAIEAVRSAKAPELDPRETIVIGESMGAARAEALAARLPEKYPRLVLVGPPSSPSPTKLHGAKAIALVAGENEPQSAVRDGLTALTSAGLPAQVWELPGATHGQYGSDGARLMREAVAFVAR